MALNTSAFPIGLSRIACTRVDAFEKSRLETMQLKKNITNIQPKQSMREIKSINGSSSKNVYKRSRMQY